MAQYEFNTFFSGEEHSVLSSLWLVTKKGKQIPRVFSISWKKLPFLTVLSTNTPNQFLTYWIDSFLHPRYAYKRLQEVCKAFNDFFEYNFVLVSNNIKSIKLTAKHAFLPLKTNQCPLKSAGWKINFVKWYLFWWHLSIFQGVTLPFNPPQLAVPLRGVLLCFAPKAEILSRRPWNLHPLSWVSSSEIKYIIFSYIPKAWLKMFFFCTQGGICYCLFPGR